ncbi:MAG TPA: iron-sulfur cluster assembly protein [Myxococcota bacterium]|nr:iron-sulfur cluster assembly protein [Myxococcota bacterium]
MLHTVFDPEIPVDIYELGLVYGVDVLPDRRVSVRMTLTSPSCPSAQQIPEEVQAKVESVDGVVSADVEIVWEPQWTPEMMSEEARLELNL